ncbi:transglutaminase-like domain-containing protein [Formosa haliotis]|uniref:transglutaminase-like domain-containing protein n=1 Tax=Formosa haliotis TaxID=1555194 RepID=UPI000824C87F|nr:transglutaminase family protein [Formosa haliotis]
MFNYNIKYTVENTYENPVFEAFWQYLVIPLNNETQQLISSEFKTSVDSRIEKSINGYNFETARIHCKKPFESIQFEAVFKVVKTEAAPLKNIENLNDEDDFKALNDLDFKIDFYSYLNGTSLTTLPEQYSGIYLFDTTKSVIENVKLLNAWVYTHLYYKTEVTAVDTSLAEIIEKRHGVCQDFTHLFCAIARKNKVPARYVSGYLHQGNGFFGDSQMHAWVEVFVPHMGWIGFDPTNNILTDHNHIKVSHGKDYNDCAPLKGVLYSTGENQTKYEVEVTYQQ